MLPREIQTAIIISLLDFFGEQRGGIVFFLFIKIYICHYSLHVNQGSSTFTNWMSFDKFALGERNNRGICLVFKKNIALLRSSSSIFAVNNIIIN